MPFFDAAFPLFGQLPKYQTEEQVAKLFEFLPESSPNI